MKKFAYILICAFMAVSLGACDSGQGKTEEVQTQEEVQTEQDETGTEVSGEVKEAEAYFPTDDKYRIYNGYAEAGFEVWYEDTVEEDGAVKYIYGGAMNDERGTVDGEARTFEVTYTIKDGSITESVDNADYMAESENRLYSKIPDMVVLSGAIEEGNSWEQEVEIDGAKTTLKTTITEVGEDSFTTVSEAEAEGYKDGKYTEERTYTKGKGLTSFSNTPYGSDKDDMLIFGYGFSIENEYSITGAA